jgi:Hemerythrin HHE cation binding domain
MKRTIYDVLGDSHDKQRTLCLRLNRTRAANSQARIETLAELRIELAAHAAAEERYLYAPMLMDDRGLQSARHALSEHHDIDELVEALQELDPAGAAWGDAAKALAHKVRHHLKEEESKFFQVSGKILTDAQKTRLAGQYQRDFVRMRRAVAQA